VRQGQAWNTCVKPWTICPAVLAARLPESADRIKWLLWHGKRCRALETIDFFEDDVSALQVDYPNLGKLPRATHGFTVYIERAALS
jgi:hypothetical protein